jgi:hypothetical protein
VYCRSIDVTFFKETVKMLIPDKGITPPLEAAVPSGLNYKSGVLPNFSRKGDVRSASKSLTK